MTAVALVDAIDRLLPQTQCRRCGYDDCHAYAGAIARGEATIDRCPPGADGTIQALARLLDQPVVPLASPWQASDARHGRQHHQRRDLRLKATHATSPRSAEDVSAGNGTADITTGHAAPRAESPTTGPAAPGTTDTLLRDPNVALVDTDEKARRLAAIRARIRMPRPRPTA